MEMNIVHGNNERHPVELQMPFACRQWRSCSRVLLLDQINELLSLACSHPAKQVSIKVLKLFVEMGASVGHQNANGVTPLFLCTASSQWHKAEFILERGAIPDETVKSYINERPSLQEEGLCPITQLNAHRLAQLLLANGANKYLDETKVVTMARDVEMVRLFVDAGANIFRIDCGLPYHRSLSDIKFRHMVLAEVYYNGQDVLHRDGTINRHDYSTYETAKIYHQRLEYDVENFSHKQSMKILEYLCSLDDRSLCIGDISYACRVGALVTLAKVHKLFLRLGRATWWPWSDFQLEGYKTTPQAMLTSPFLLEFASTLHRTAIKTTRSFGLNGRYFIAYLEQFSSLKEPYLESPKSLLHMSCYAVFRVVVLGGQTPEQSVAQLSLPAALRKLVCTSEMYMHHLKVETAVTLDSFRRPRLLQLNRGSF